MQRDRRKLGMKILRSNLYYIPKNECSKEYLEQLVVPNPAFTRAKLNGYSTKNIPETICLYQEKYIEGFGQVIGVPRHWSLPKHKDVEIIDRRIEGNKVSFNCKITLYPRQVPAVEALAQSEDGILEAPCGQGKTIMGLTAMTRVGVTTLILVHKSFLIDQWKSAIKFVTGEEPGVIQGPLETWDWKGRKVVIGMLQSLYYHRDSIPEDLLNYFGLIIGDEIHRMSAPTFSYVISLFPAKRRWGLTATPERADKLEFIFHAHLGEIVYALEKTKLKPLVLMAYTNCFLPTDFYCKNKWGKPISPNLSRLITGLTLLEKRNKIILQNLLSAAKEGRKILLLTDRVQHAKYLKQQFDANAGGGDITTSLYLGETTPEERKVAEEADVIFATTQMAKEALDIPSLDTLFLASPSGSKITVQQAAGRILREYPGKKNPLVVDFVDDNIQTRRLANIRACVYKALKYPIKGVELS